MAKLGVQIINHAKLFVRNWYLEINRSLFVRLCWAAFVLVGDEVFVQEEQGSTHALLAREAADLPAQLYLERFDRLLASRVIHVELHFDFLSGEEACLLK